MAPLQRGSTAVGHAVIGTWRGVGELMHSREENETLRQRVRELEEQVTRLGEAELENVRLRRLLDLRETLRGDVLTARVIGRDATGIARTLVVDRGEADGVVKGAAVLAPEGIVGQVFLASRHAARVLLINDHNSGVDALVQRTRARGIVEGIVDDGCGLKFVKRTEDVQVGDAVITSGLDGIFPKSLPIGQVVAVDKFSGTVLGTNAFALTAVYAGVTLIARNLWIEGGLPAMAIVFLGALGREVATAAVGVVVAAHAPIWQHMMRHGLLEAAAAAL